MNAGRFTVDEARVWIPELLENVEIECQIVAASGARNVPAARILCVIMLLINMSYYAFNRPFHNISMFLIGWQWQTIPELQGWIVPDLVDVNIDMELGRLVIYASDRL